MKECILCKERCDRFEVICSNCIICPRCNEKSGVFHNVQTDLVWFRCFRCLYFWESMRKVK